MAALTLLEQLRSLIAEGDGIIAMNEFKAADVQFDRWMIEVSSVLRERRVNSPLLLQWVNLCPKELMYARDRKSLPELRKVMRERLAWLGSNLSDMQMLEGTAAQFHGRGTERSTDHRFSRADHAKPSENNRKVFIVHGHDHSLKNAVARYVELLGLESVVLQERPDRGQTIIDKLDSESHVGFAVVLMTADDFGESVKALRNASPTELEESLQSRARQNVVLELGHFMGKLGRNRVAIIIDSGVEIPSDISGVVYISREQWVKRLWTELKEAGYEFSLDQVQKAIVIV